jgi:hypothetical protein
VANGNLRQLEEVAQMDKEVLEKMRRILKVEHPFTMVAMNNFASPICSKTKVSSTTRSIPGDHCAANEACSWIRIFSHKSCFL